MYIVVSHAQFMLVYTIVLYSEAVCCVEVNTELPHNVVVGANY